MVATGGMTYISRLNYPGGHVWEALEELQAGSNESGTSPQAFCMSAQAVIRRCPSDHVARPEVSSRIWGLIRYDQISPHDRPTASRMFKHPIIFVTSYDSDHRDADTDTDTDSIVRIHFSPYPLSTGSSLFTFLHAASPYTSQNSTFWQTIPGPGSTSRTPSSSDDQVAPIWEYSKSESPALLTSLGAAQADMTYVILSIPELEEGKWLEPVDDDGQEPVKKQEKGSVVATYGNEVLWEVKRRIKGYAGMKRVGWRVGVRMEDQVVVLGRKRRVGREG